MRLSPGRPGHRKSPPTTRKGRDRHADRGHGGCRCGDRRRRDPKSLGHHGCRGHRCRLGWILLTIRRPGAGESLRARLRWGDEVVSQAGGETGLTAGGVASVSLRRIRKPTERMPSAEQDDTSERTSRGIDVIFEISQPTTLRLGRKTRHQVGGSPTISHNKGHVKSKTVVPRARRRGRGRPTTIEHTGGAKHR